MHPHVIHGPYTNMDGCHAGARVCASMLLQIGYDDDSESLQFCLLESVTIGLADRNTEPAGRSGQGQPDSETDSESSEPD
jgi:hypothetical protein